MHRHFGGLDDAAFISVYMPHSGRNEVDYIEALEAVKATLVEGKEWEPWIFHRRRLEHCVKVVPR